MFVKQLEKQTEKYLLSGWTQLTRTFCPCFDRGKATSKTPALLQFSMPELDCLSGLLVEAFESAESQHPSTISNLDTDLALHEEKCVEHISRRRSPGKPRVDVEDPIAFWFIQVIRQ